MLRDKFAMAAMQGMSANPNGEDWTFNQIAEWAYKQADAMMKERANWDFSGEPVPPLVPAPPIE